MKTFVIVTCILIIARLSHSQNLVPNGGFETIDPSLGCPAQDGFTIGRPDQWLGYHLGQYNLDADYFHPCAENNGANNYPGSNEAGCEYPLDGSAYAGFVAFFANSGSPATSSEYLYTSVSLTGGQQYYVEFYVSNAEGCSGPGCGFPSTFYSKNLGMYFTNSGIPPDGQVNGLNHLTPHIPNSFPTSSFHTTTNGWERINGYYSNAGPDLPSWY